MAIGAVVAFGSVDVGVEGSCWVSADDGGGCFDFVAFEDFAALEDDVIVEG